MSFANGFFVLTVADCAQQQLLFYFEPVLIEGANNGSLLSISNPRIADGCWTVGNCHK